MANTIFLADITIPGQSAVDLRRRASDVIEGIAARSQDLRSAFQGADSRILRDLGLDRAAC